MRSWPDNSAKSREGPFCQWAGDGEVRDWTAKGPSYDFRQSNLALGLLVLPMLAFFFARAEQLGAEKLQKFVAARLLPELAGTVNRGRRIFRFVLLLLVLGLVLVSLARPRWGYTYDEVKRKGLDLLLAVDVSRSMLSNDVQPKSSRTRQTGDAGPDQRAARRSRRPDRLCRPRLPPGTPHDRLRRRHRFDQRPRHKNHPGRRDQYFRGDRARDPDLRQVRHW